MKNAHVKTNFLYIFSGFSVKKVSSFVHQFIPEAKLTEEGMTELCYQLPDEAAHRGDFARLFAALETSHLELGISSFGISDTSLEEVGRTLCFVS